MSKENAVIYARFSSHNQREESIEGQVRECTAFAERQNLQVVRVYADRAISGRTDGRPEFQQMIADSANKGFTKVIVYTFDRFARDRYASAIYKHQLKANGVRVLSCKEAIDSSPSGVLMEALYEGMAEYYSLELAQKVKRGMKENALKGRWSSGAPPFGYEVNADRTLKINEAIRADLVEAFNMAARGERLQAIANFLNSKGHRPPNGRKGKFGAHNIPNALKNPIVIGIFKWDDVVIEDYIEPIISKALFETVQYNLAHRKGLGEINLKKSDKYLLTPNIWCGECGSRMNGVCGTASNGNRYYYYKCAGKLKKKTNCSCQPIPRDQLEDAIYERICSVLKRQENIEAIAETAIDILQANADKELPYMRQQLATKKQERDRGITAVLNGLTSPALTERIQELDAEIAALEENIAITAANTKPVELTQDHIVFFLESILGEDRDRVIQAMVKKVIVNKKDSDGNIPITVQMNYSSNTELPDTDTEEVKIRILKDMVGPVGFEPTTSRL